MSISIRSRILKTETIDWRKAQWLQNDNLKSFTLEAKEKLKASMRANDFVMPFHVWKDDEGATWILDGHHRQRALLELADAGYVPELLPATFIDCDNKQDAAKLVLIYSSHYARIEEQGLSEFLDLYDLDLDSIRDEIDIPSFDGFTLPDDDAPVNTSKTGSLSERFLVPPFSVFDTRQAYWQNRKQEWLALGIRSEIGRGEGLTYAASAQSPKFYEVKNELRAAGLPCDTESVRAECEQRGLSLFGSEAGSTSIFDPVLCEVVCRWFCPKGGLVLDPFAGGSVRGIVAAKIGLTYHGIDLSEIQVEANRKNALEVMSNDETLPKWHAGDSLQVVSIVEGMAFDLIFSCPPYGDLEVYSDNKSDLSNMNHDKFLSAYREIISKSLQLLKPNRFAVFVVGDFRDKHGFYRNFVSDTIAAFQAGGAILYNEIILFTQPGSLPIRVGRQFSTGRKIGKTHQNVLVFYKGDPKNIGPTFGTLDFSEIEVGGMEIEPSQE